jgi:DNA-binding transcriptional LysR family regulator
MRATAPRLDGLDLNLLTVFAAIRSEGSITRAAERMGMTQAGASRALSRLRARFDDPLFARTRTGLVLTPRGASLAHAVSDILQIVEHRVLPARIFDPKLHRRVFRIATADYCEVLLLGPALARLTKEAPHIEVETLPTLANDSERLSSGEIDLVIALKPKAGADLRTRKLMTDRFTCLLRAGHPAVHDGELTLSAYLMLEHVLPAPHSKPGGPLDEALLRARLTRKTAVRVHSFMAVPALLTCSDMVATVPESFAAYVTRTHGLRSIPVPLAVPGFDLFLTWHERTDADAAHRWMREAIRVEATRHFGIDAAGVHVNPKEDVPNGSDLPSVAQRSE